MTLGPSQPPTPSCILLIDVYLKSSQNYIIISMMTSFMRMSQKLVFHQSNCICAITHILSTTAMYVSSSSFMYLRFPCYSDAYLNSSALRVGVKTLLNTIQLVQDLRVCFSITATLLCLFSFMHLCVTSKCHVCSLLFLCGWV